MTYDSLEYLFQNFDYDKSGTLDLEEFKMCLKALKLNLTEDEITQILYMADENGDGSISYEEFVEFLGSQVKKSDPPPLIPITTADRSVINKLFGEKIGLYELEKEDYFLGNTTILNSEIACLKRCYELIDKIGGLQAADVADNDWKKFTDPDFGPQGLEDVSHETFFYGRKLKGYPEPASIQWFRPAKIVSRSSTARFLANSLHPRMIKQGVLGDSWFIGALGILSTNPKYIMYSLPD